MSEHDEVDDVSVWDEASGEAENEGSGNKYDDGASLFLKLEKGKTYTVRLVKQPECFRLHWQAFKSIQRGPVSSPAFKEEDRAKDVAWVKGGWKPQKRFAAPVINRETGKIQLLEGGTDIFNPIFALYAQTKKKAAEGKGKVINPAGEPAPDWIITVGTTTMKNGKERLSFGCQPDVTAGMNHFSEEEKELIAKFTYDWRQHYAKKTPEEISDLWESLPDDKKYHPNRQKQVGTANAGKAAQQGKTATTQKAPPKAPVVEDSPFGDGDADDHDDADSGEDASNNQAASLF
jgi:hypothetical protein